MIIKFILISMVVLSPFARGSVSPLAFGPLQILTAIALLLWFSRMFNQRLIKIKRTPLDIPILLFFILAIASIFRSPSMHDSIAEFFKLLNVIVIFYLVVNHIKERRQILTMLNLVVMLGVVLSVFGIIQYFGGVTNSWWADKNFLSSVYVNHNHFAGFLELCIPLCLGLALVAKSTEKRLFYIYLFILMLVAFIFCMSRGGWFSLSVSMAAMYILLHKRRFVKRGVVVTLFLLIPIGFLIIKDINLALLTSRIAAYKELDFAGRFEIWRGTFKIIQHRPFFGTGLGTFIYYFPQYRPIGFNRFANYAHNDYLQVWSEMGIFGLLCMVYIFFLIVKSGVTTYFISHSDFKKGVSLGVVIGILSIAVHSLGDFNLKIPANAILFSVLSGVIFNLRSRKEDADSYFELRLNKVSLYLFRPMFNVIVFVWILCTARLVMAEAISNGIKTSSFSDRVRILNRAIYILPENNTYYKALGQTYINKASISLYRENDLLMALEYYLQASKINPMDAWAWVGAGDAFLYLGLVERAEDAYRKSVTLDPNNSYYLKKLGNLLAGEGDVVGSLEMFKRVSLVEPWYDGDDPNIYAEKGDLYRRKGDLDDALNMYKLAGQLDPKRKDIRIKMLSVLERMGQKDKIKKYISPIFLDNSENLLLLNSRARYFISKGKYREADALIEKALSINNNDSITLQNKIDLLQKQRKHFVNVKPYMQRLLKLNEGSAEGVISGKNIILAFDLEKEGIMPASAIKEIGFVLPIGLIDVRILASGTFAKDEWPHMLVRMNSRSILSTYVPSSSYIEFNASGVSQEGPNSIYIEFSNDYLDSITGEDRNLTIKKVILEYKYPDYEN